MYSRFVAEDNKGRRVRQMINRVDDVLESLIDRLIILYFKPKQGATKSHHLQGI